MMEIGNLKVGAFRHGGVTGLDWLTRLMVRCILQLVLDASFTAGYMSVDTERDIHKDKNNQEIALNYVLPVSIPRSGGGLWLELRPGDIVCGEVTEREDEKRRKRYGSVHALEKNKVKVFDPRRWHGTEPWKGHNADCAYPSTEVYAVFRGREDVDKAWLSRRRRICGLGDGG